MSHRNRSLGHKLSRVAKRRRRLMKEKLEQRVVLSAVLFDVVNTTNTEFNEIASYTSDAGVSILESEGQTLVGEDGLLGSSPIDSYEVSLNTVPSGPVEVTVSADSQTEVSLDGVNFASSVSVTRSDTAPASVFVRGFDDALQEGIHSGTLNHAITASNDPNYPIGPIGSPVNATIADDELQPVIGIDFGGDVGSTPPNWNFQQSLWNSGGVFVSNLIREDGATTEVGFTLPQRLSTGGSNSAPAAIPFHSPSLEAIDGNVFDNEPIELTWTGLIPGEDYHVYVLTSENYGQYTDYTQNVVVDALVRPNSFVQETDGLASGLLVNTGVASASKPLEDDAIIAQADTAGEIKVTISAVPGSPVADGLLSAAAIQRVASGTPGISVTLSENDVVVSDAQTSDTFEVSLKTAPGGTVVIDLLSGDSSEFVLSESLLYFDDSNWNIPQTVTVTGLSDGLSDGTQTSELRLAVETGATTSAIYDAAADRTFDVISTDDHLSPLIGMDFDATSTHPLNWNGATNPDFGSWTDLFDEEGNATAIDLTVAFANLSASQYSDGPITTLPVHPVSLAEISGGWRGTDDITLVWSDLTPNTDYDVWLFAEHPFGDSVGQTVTVSGAVSGQSAFAITPATNEFWINGSSVDPARTLPEDAIRATADNQGQIQILIDHDNTGTYNVVSGTAIREASAALSYDASLSVSTHGEETGPVDIVYTVTLDPPNTTGGPITFDLNDLDSGTAQAGSDYQAISSNAQIVIPDGSATGSYTVSVIDDADTEPLETVAMQIANPSVSGVTMLPQTAVADITDNDGTPQLFVDVHAGSISEAAGNGATQVTISRTGDLSDSLDVILTSSDPSEARLITTATIAAGQASVTVDLNAVDDTAADGDQIVTITATTAAGFAVDGSVGIDFEFGIFGKQSTALQAVYQPPQGVIAALPDGKILAASEATANDQITVVRHNPDGSVDSSFGSSGTVLATIGAGDPTLGPNDPFPHAIEIAKDGSFFIGGVYASGVETPFLAKFRADGSLDMAYGNGGLVDLSSLGFVSVRALDVTDDGKLIAAISSQNGVDYLAIRVNPDGRLDFSFGNQGRTSFGGIAVEPTDIEALGEGEFVLLGESNAAGVLLRSDRYGNLDQTFGDYGTATLGLGATSGRAGDLDVDAAGRIVVAGTKVEDFDRNLLVARFSPDGQADTSFGSNGVVSLDVNGGHSDFGTSLEVGIEGKLYLVGYTAPATSDNRAVVVRLLDNGGLDTSFDSDGKLVTPIGNHPNQQTLGSAFDSDGGLLLLGGNQTDIQIARITLDVVPYVGSDSVTVTDNEGTLFFDYGDAPSAPQSGFASSYPVTFGESGARHNVTIGGPRLGFLAEADAGGVHSADATFDDTNGSDDEDGVVFRSPVYGSSSTSLTGHVTVELQNAAPTANYLDAWIDFNRDGDWNDPGEQIFTSFDLGTTNGSRDLTFSVPVDAGDNYVNGLTFARFRISSGGGLSPTGTANDGEVEDVAVTLVNTDPILVDTLIDESDGDYSPGDLSLREAIELANEIAGGNQIEFAPGLSGGTISLTMDQLIVKDDLTITGLGATNLTVSGNDLFRVLRVDQMGSLTLEGLTISNGRPNDPGSAADGAGILSFGDLVLRDVVVTQNRTQGSSGNGAGIFISNSSLTLTDSVVSNNSTNGTNLAGGGIYALNVNVSISRSVIEGNRTFGDASPAAGILVIGDLTMDQSTVANNVASGLNSAGGGVIVAGGNLTVTGSTIHGNSATGSGGGLAFDATNSTADITNTTVSGNATGGSGGGIALFAGTFNVNHSTITENASAPTAAGAGVVAFESNHRLTIYSSIVAGNEGTDVEREFSPGVPAAPPQTVFSGGFNVFGHTDTQHNFTLTSDQTGVLARLAALADNGGPTLTHALLAGSPAIDAGETSSPLPYDQRGNGFPRLVGTNVDAGAFEAAAVPQLSVTASDAWKNEGDSGTVPFTFTVIRGLNTDGVTTVDYNVSGAGGTPADANDFAGATFPSGTISFADGESTKTITVQIAGDTLIEPNEAFAVTLTNPSAGAIVVGAVANGVILNDDIFVATANLSVTQQGNEAGTVPLEFTVTLDQPNSSGIPINFDISNLGTGTASNGTDHAAFSTLSVTVPAGASSGSITVAVVDDSQFEGIETVNVQLANPSQSGIILGTSTATGNILDDDTQPTLTVDIEDLSVIEGDGDVASVVRVTRSGSTSSSLVVTLVSSDESEALVTSTVTIGAGRTFGVGWLEVVDDVILDGPQVVTVTASATGFLGDSDTVTIIDNDQAGFTAFGGPAVTAWSGSGDAGTGPFGTPWSVYSNNSPSRSVWASPTYQFGSEPFQGQGAYDAYRVTFSGLPDGVSIDADYFDTILRINPPVSGRIWDEEITGNSILFTSSDPINQRLEQGDDFLVRVGFTDQVDPQSLQFDVEYIDSRVTTSGLTVSETGTTETFDVVLNAQPVSDVVIELQGNDPSEISLSTNQLTFSPSNWNQPQTVTVRGIDDSVVDGDVPALIMMSVNDTLSDDLFDVVADQVVQTTTLDDDTASVTVSDVSALEGNQLLFTATLDKDVQDPFTVQVDVSGLTATGGTDYTNSSPITLSFSGVANEQRTFSVQTLEDSSVEPEETLLVSLQSSNPRVTATDTATGTIDDDDVATISFANGRSVLAENGGTTTFDVRLNLQPGFILAADVSVDIVDLVSGTAASADYTFSRQTVTFNAGSADGAIRTVSATLNEDVNVEGDETIHLGLTNLVDGTDGQVSVGIIDAHTVTITDDDQAFISFSNASSSTSESSATYSVDVTLSIPDGGSLLRSLSADIGIVSASPGSATAGSDYSYSTQTLTWYVSPFNTTQSITLDIINDAVVEGNETINLELLNLDIPVGALVQFATPQSYQITITDDDVDPQTLAIVADSAVKNEGDSGETAFTFKVTRSGDTTGATSVDYVVTGSGPTPASATDFSGGASPSGTVQFAAGETSRTITVNVSGDEIVEANQGFSVTLSNPSASAIIATASATGTITNDDESSVNVSVSPESISEDATGTLLYTFTRDNVSSETPALTANVGVDGTATAGTDYTPTPAATLTFATGESSTTLTIDPTADALVEPDETVVLQVLAGAGYAVGANASATGTIINDDSVSLISIAVAPEMVQEDGSENLIYTLTRTGDASTELAVNFTASGSATPGTDYQLFATASVTFAPGEATTLVSVNPISDTIVEADEEVTLTLQAGTGYAIAANAAATGTITNDDESVVNVSVAPSSIGEDGPGSLVYTFTRDNVSGETPGITVNFSTAGSATPNVDFTADVVDEFVFAAGQSAATVTVTPNPDTVVEPDETVVLMVNPANGYVAGPKASATATILNDDIDGPTVGVLNVTYFNDDVEQERNYIGDASGQRSIIRKVEIVFSGPLQVAVGSVTDGSFVVTTTSGPQAGSTVDLEVVRSELINGRQVVTLKFNGKDAIEPASRKKQGERAMLVDGTYRLNISGAILGIDANGKADGTDAVDDFFRLFGDYDGDADVDSDDYNRFLEFVADGDHNVIFDFDDAPSRRKRDRVEFMKRFGTRLEQP